MGNRPSLSDRTGLANLLIAYLGLIATLIGFALATDTDIVEYKLHDDRSQKVLHCRLENLTDKDIESVVFDFREPEGSAEFISARLNNPNENTDDYQHDFIPDKKNVISVFIGLLPVDEQADIEITYKGTSSGKLKVLTRAVDESNKFGLQERGIGTMFIRIIRSRTNLVIAALAITLIFGIITVIMVFGKQRKLQTTDHAAAGLSDESTPAIQTPDTTTEAARADSPPRPPGPREASAGNTHHQDRNTESR